MTQFKINYKYEIMLLLMKKQVHGREIAKELNTSLTRIQAKLKELRELNILDYQAQGKNHTYFIKKNLSSKSLIINAENYKLTKLLTKHPELEPIFEDILKITKNELVLLFGSYAKFKENKNSDMDIYIETTNKTIKEEAEEIYSKINIKIGDFKKENLLIKEIIKDHIIIRGSELYYERIFN